MSSTGLTVTVFAVDQSVVVKLSVAGETVTAPVSSELGVIVTVRAGCLSSTTV